MTTIPISSYHSRAPSPQGKLSVAFWFVEAEWALDRGEQIRGVRAALVHDTNMQLYRNVATQFRTTYSRKWPPRLAE
jgi:hypothetical protein